MEYNGSNTSFHAAKVLHFAESLEELLLCLTTWLHHCVGGARPFFRLAPSEKPIARRYKRLEADIQQQPKRMQLQRATAIKAEYQMAVGAAQMADKWAAYQKEGDQYDLLYLTAGDTAVREEHALLDQTCLPPSDPAWATIYPPNGWGCRCNVIQVLAGSQPRSDSRRAIDTMEAITQGKQAIFRFNPALAGRIFPPKHPYYGKKGYEHCINPKLAQEEDKGQKEVCEVLQALQAENREPQPIIIEKAPNGKTITQYDNVDSSKSDYQQVHSTAQFFARKMGRNVEILPNLGDGKRFDYKAIFSDLMGTRYEGKCPDLKVEGLGYVEVKGFEEGAKGKRALSNMLKRGLKQSDRVVIQRHPEWTERHLRRNISARIEAGQEIKQVWILEEDGTLTLLFESTEGRLF